MRTRPQVVRRVVASGLFTVTVIVGSLALAGVSSTKASTSPLSARVADECILKCETCPVSGHKADTGTGNGGVAHAGCWAGNTCEAHVCTPEDEVLGGGTKVNLNDVWNAVSNAGPRDLVLLAARYPNVVTYNHAREAIQLLDCKKNVWAHVPVNHEVATILDGSLKSGT